MTKAFLTIGLGAKKIGTLELELYSKDVPKTVQNFVHQLEKNFKGCKFHRIIPKFMAQGGDFTHGDGTGGTSMYGDSFEDENFFHSHSRRGMLSMANSGKDTNGSQFFITFRATEHLDGKHVVFGHVVDGLDVLQAMENVSTGRNNVPKVPVVILDCGVRDVDAGEKSAPVIAAADNNEIELDEEDEVTDLAGTASLEEVPEDTNGNSLKDRLRRLKMKMNQARQLNRREVLREGERLGSEEAKTKEHQRLQKEERQRREKEWQERNGKAIEIAKKAGYEDGKFLVEPADKSLARAQKRQATQERNQYSVNDHYNPGGQHRHYERNLKSLPKDIDRAETGTYNPVAAVMNSENDQAAGARRLAAEMKRRIEKQKQKRDRLEFEGEDVDYINKRNKMFNKKISRNYDKSTAEIRQNLERGTAL